MTFFQSDRRKRSHLVAGLLLLFLLPAGAYGAGLCQLTPVTNHPAPDHTVEGVVTDTSGQPLAGVTIQLKGTSQGTVTDAAGQFHIGVPDKAVLVVSYIGYTSREIQVGTQTRLKIELQSSASGLNEVVVLGYTRTSKKTLTGSADVVDEKALTDVVATDASKMLQGKASGVFIGNSSGNPNADPAIRVRGNGTLTAGNGPLIVVDGVISTGMPVPSDIASLTVLKDAAATTLYGARAANGVIVITTKRGKTGKTVLALDATAGVARKNDGHFAMMGTDAYYQLLYAAYKRDYTGNDFDHYIQSKLPPALKKIHTDWQDLAFRSGAIQHYELSARGGSEKTRFYLSGDYYNEKGIVAGTEMNRYSARMNLDHDFNDKLSIRFDMNASLEKGEDDNSAGTLYEAYTNLPWDRAYDDQGHPIDPREVTWYGRNQTNFLYNLQYNRNHHRELDLGGLLKLEYAFTDWLRFSTTNRAQYKNYRTQNNHDPRTTDGADNHGDLYNYYDYASTYLSSNLLTFSKTMGTIHHIDALAGAEFQQHHFDDMGGTGKGILQGMDVLNVTAAPLNLTGDKLEYAFNSYFFQFNYNYDYRYYLTSSFRRDGSSKFGYKNRWGNFYAVGLAWLASEETFIKQLSAISNLKFRLSYGTTGNADIDPYDSYGLYNTQTQYGGQPAAYPETVASPYLSWEKAHTANLGIDLGLFDRINLSVDVYQKDNKDLLFDLPLAATTGYSYVTRNVGSVRNRGIEMVLSTRNLTGAVKWTTDFNISFNNNHITRLYGGQSQIIDPANDHFILQVGQDMRTFYLRKWHGVDPENGDPLWETVDENGKVSYSNDYNAATLQRVGSASPDFFGGMRNVLTYRSFTLSVFFNFVSGNRIYNTERELFDNDGAYYAFNLMQLDKGWSRWQQPGDQATHPKLVIGGNKNSHKPSSRFLEDGSYLRLRDVSLSYGLPGDFVKKMHASQVVLSVSANNLWTLTRFSGMDPDVDDRGIQGFKYPFSRKVTGTLSIQF